MRNVNVRTGLTDLADSELLILDQIATGRAVWSMFFGDVFPHQFNCENHGLNNEALVATLRRFEQEGFTVGKSVLNQWDKNDRSVFLTEKGGTLWELERRPDWTRYVTDCYSTSPRTQRNRVAIFGHSRQVCTAFFEAGMTSGFLGVCRGEVKSRVCERSLIYWRPKQNTFLLSAWLEQECSKTDWNHLESKRCWWRIANEIGALWGWSPATLS